MSVIHSKTMAETTEKPRTFITIYEDEKGRFISDSEYPTWQEAHENRDQLSSYRETVEIVRHHHTNCETSEKNATPFHKPLSGSSYYKREPPL